MTISIKAKAGSFAENKDVARALRDERIMPAIKAGKQVTLNFGGVTGATQSFIHALISEAIRSYGDDVFDRLYFKDCNDTLRALINIVADYMQES